MGRFYVYILFRPSGVPCYVGKGQGSRWTYHERAGLKHENKHLARIIANAGGSIPRVKIREGLTNDEAIETEMALIAAIGRGSSGPLVNLTDGGDGQTGWNPSAETRAKIGMGREGKLHSTATKTAMSIARKGRVKTEAHKRKIGASQVGKTIPEATRAKMREAAARRWARPEEHANIRAFYASMTPEAKSARAKNISTKTKAAMLAPEVRQKISDARRAS